MSEISKQALKVDNSTSFPNNTTGYISPTILRNFNINMIDSLVEQEGYTADSASWNSEISGLQSFSSSFTASYDGLNSFTASTSASLHSLNVNTQSVNNSITLLDAFSASFYAYTASINEIQSNGVTLGNSTRFNLVGPGTFFSASLVQNVNGPIATLTFSSDNSKLNTSSFNDYTASTAASQSVVSASVSTSIKALNSFTSSATASISQLLTFSSSFNQFTSSLVGFATTGSNIFVGDQTIYKAEGKLLFQSGSSNTADVKMTAAGNLQLSVNNTSGILVESNAVTLQHDSTISGNATINGNLNLYASNVGVNIAANAASSGSPYNIVTNFVDTTTDGTNVYSGYQLIDSVDGGNYASLAVTSYSSEYPGVSTGVIIGGKYTNGSDTAIGFPSNAGIDLWKPTYAKNGLSVSSSISITGSAHGNVVALTITSNTASLDLNKGNFFTLSLANGTSTNINITNVQPGTTALLQITNGGIQSASFSSNVKQQRYNAYVPTSGSNTIDLLSIQAFNNSTVFVTKANNFV